MANIYVTEQHRETDDSILTQAKDGVITLMQKVGKVIFEAENKKVQESKCKERYFAEVSTLPIVRMQ
ncbi:MAG: hypothetical protein ACTSYA_00195 [Candidatus Kariarchaeaceae archaeon]